MKRGFRRTVCIGVALLAIIGICLWVFWPRGTVITFGMMAGSYWDVPNGNCYQIVDGVIRRFEAAHPGVRVEYTSGIMKRDYSEWLSEQMLLGKGPDVFMVEPDDVNTFSSIGALKPLNDFIAKDGNFRASDYYAAAYGAGVYRGKQYALPYESVPSMMFINKTLLSREKIPMPKDNWTWNDFYAICRQVTRDTNGDGRTDQFGCYDYAWEDAAYSNGATLFNADGTDCYLNDSKVEEAIQFIRKLSNLSKDSSPTSNDFDFGRVAFRPFLFSDYRAYKPYPWSIKKYSNFEWDCIKMPAGPSGGNVSELNTLLMGISSKTSHSELAWEFLKMLTNDETTQQEIFQYSQGVSVLKKVTKSVETQTLLKQDMPVGQRFRPDALDEVMSSAVTIPKFKKYHNVIQLADGRIDKLISDNQNVSTALMTLRKDTLNYLEQ